MKSFYGTGYMTSLVGELGPWWAHVSNAEVLQRSGLSTIGDIFRHGCLLCLAMLHAWILEYQQVMLCI